MFETKNEFLEHSMKLFGKLYTCCKCKIAFKNCTLLYQHYETHKDDLTENSLMLTEQIIEGDVEELVLNYGGDNEEVIVHQPSISEANELLYILDDSQCVNEVVIQEDEPIAEKTPENVSVVNFEHGYVNANELGEKEDEEEAAEDEIIMEEVESEFLDKDGQKFIISRFTLPKSVTPSVANKKIFSQTKSRAPQPKRRHEVPDFSATNYELINANSEVDQPHYKCLRCEQLFISKFVFFRHIEKGKCYINNCDVCNASFNKNSEFYAHYSAAHTDRAICYFCFRTFMYEKNVKEHMLRHLDQFRHRCEDCNKGFYTVREYRNHYKNRHMGIRHKCAICGRSFADEYYFKRHIAMHAKANVTILEVQDQEQDQDS